VDIFTSEQPIKLTVRCKIYIRSIQVNEIKKGKLVLNILVTCTSEQNMRSYISACTLIGPLQLGS